MLIIWSWWVSIPILISVFIQIYYDSLESINDDIKCRYHLIFAVWISTNYTLYKLISLPGWWLLIDWNSWATYRVCEMHQFEEKTHSIRVNDNNGKSWNVVSNLLFEWILVQDQISTNLKTPLGWALINNWLDFLSQWWIRFSRERRWLKAVALVIAMIQTPLKSDREMQDLT